MTYNDLINEWIRLKKEFDLNPAKELHDEIEKVDKKLRDLDKQLQRYYTPRGNYGDKKEN